MPEGESFISPQEAGILPQKYPDLHKSAEVGLAVDDAKRRGEKVPNNPKETVSRYLGSLLNRHGLLGGGGERQERQIAKHVIKRDEIPEGYFENQRRIARERGHGDIEITSEMRQQMAETVIADQKKSLEKWVDYINHPDANYPAWFRYYAIRSVLTLGPYDKEKHQFSKRSKGTAAPYADLSREALAHVYDNLNKSFHGERIEEQDDEKLASLLKSKNFGKLYAHAIETYTPASKEQRKVTTGEWKKYEQIEDNEEGDKRAKELSDSLEGHATDWCTAAESTAKLQLQEGDFYVYYSNDEDDKPTIPRVAIRMEQGQVAEVRGIDKDQELEPTLIETAEEKLATLPGGDKFKQKAADMKRLTQIEKKQKEQESLNEEELRFLYELDREIEGFGFEKDPRIEEIRDQRDKRQDGAILFKCEPEQIALDQYELTDKSIALFGNFSALDEFDRETIYTLPPHLRYIYGDADLRLYPNKDISGLEYIHGEANFGHSEIITLGNLKHIGGDAEFSWSKVTDLGELESIGGVAWFNNSQIKDLGDLKYVRSAHFSRSEVTNLGKLERIERMADFSKSKVASLGELKFIGGGAFFSGSEITDLGKLEEIGGNAAFNSSKVTNLGELRTIGWDATFSDSPIKQLGKLEKIGGNAAFDRSEVIDLGELKSIGGEAEFSYSEIPSLGKLEYIGGAAIFLGSGVHDLGALKEIGKNANFELSHIENLGELKSIGGDSIVDLLSSTYEKNKEKIKEVTKGKVILQ